jgi:DNA helicase-2/ATP-dependent DNA helicase PcrA
LKQDDYTPEQQRFIENPDARSVLLAPPGSGKTHTLMGRIKWLEQNDPAPLVALTFTNRAARELEQRIAADPDLARYKDQIWAGTFHSYCIEAMRRFPSLRDTYGLEPDFAVAPRPEGRTEADIMACTLGHQLKQLAHDMGHKETLSKVAKRLEWDADFETIWTHRLVSQNIVDYEFVMRSAPEILRRPDCAYRPAHIVVDEIQDVGHQERLTIEAFATFAKTISTVGDPDQSIYGFRGAAPVWCESGLKNQGFDYYRLSMNFRSGDAIIETLNRIFPGKCQAVDRPATVRVVKHLNEAAEAQWIADDIIDRIAKGQRPGGIAVIARRHARYATVARVLAERGIPVESPNDTIRAAREKPVADTLAVLRALARPDVGPTLLHAALVLGAPESMVNDLRLKALERRTSVLALVRDECSGISPWQELLALIEAPAGLDQARAMLERAINLVHDQTGAWFSEDGRDAIDRYWIAWAKNGDKSAGLAGFVVFVDTCRPQDLIEDAADAVVCGSIHGVKGLEYDVVYLIGLEKGETPKELRDSNAREELRIFYVGASRARHCLILCKVLEKERFAGSGRPVPVEPSPYLELVGVVDR